MNERIRRLQAHLLEVADDWHQGAIAEDQYLAYSACAIEGTLEMLCADNAPQRDLDYVGKMLGKLLAEGKH